MIEKAGNMLLYIPLLQVQVAAKGASLPIDMFCCCCWSYVLLALVVLLKSS